MSEERLQKVLARAGIASRRAAETMILQGRVKVDGRVVRELGVRVDARAARVDVDGRRVVAEPFVYILLHKPRGVMTTLHDPEGRQTIAELLPRLGVRLVPVGRLDYHTSGALICTNDGDFAARLLHPRGEVPKEYVAKVHGVVNETSLERWRESIVIEGRPTRPAEVRILRHEGDKTWLSIVLREGRNRQVRRLGEATGFAVLRLARTAHAGITTEDLRPGQWRHLTRDELVDLKKAYGVPKSVRSAATPDPGPAKARPQRGAAAAARPRAPGRERARPGNARPPNARASDARPTNARASNARPANARASDARPTNARASNARPTNVRPTNARASQPKRRA